MKPPSDMKIKTTKDSKSLSPLIFTVELEPENEQDVKALSNLNTESLHVTDQMINELIDQEADRIRDENAPTWKVEHEKKKGHNNVFFVRLIEPSDQ